MIFTGSVYDHYEIKKFDDTTTCYSKYKSKGLMQIVLLQHLPQPFSLHKISQVEILYRV